MVLRLELLGLGDVNLTVIPLSVALRLEPQRLALGVHHRPIVVAHVRGEDDLLLVGRLETRQLDVDRDARALGDGPLAGGETPAGAAAAGKGRGGSAPAAPAAARPARHRINL